MKDLRAYYDVAQEGNWTLYQPKNPTPRHILLVGTLQHLPINDLRHEVDHNFDGAFVFTADPDQAERFMSIFVTGM